MNYEERGILKQRITKQRNFLVSEHAQLLRCEDYTTILEVVYKEEKLHRFSKRIRRLKYLYDKITEENK